MGIFDIFRKNKQKDQVNIVQKPFFLKKKLGSSSIITSSYDKAFNYTYNLQMIELYKAYRGNDLFRSAITKTQNLQLRQNFSIVSADNGIQKYLNKRLFEISIASNKSIKSIVYQLSKDFVLYGNAFLYLHRDKSNSSGKKYKYFGKTLEPISAIFVVPPRFVSISEDEKTYSISPAFFETYQFINVYDDEDEVVVGRGEKVVKKENIIHLKYEDDGKVFSDSYYLQALTPLIILTTLEDVVEQMIRERQFFVTVYTVGTKDNPPDEMTFERIKSSLEWNPEEGVLIIPGHHSIEIKNMSTLKDIQTYIEYFKTKFLNAVQIASVGLGESGSQNRATAETSNSITYDLVNDFQQTFAEQFSFSFLTQLILDRGMSLDKIDIEKMPQIYFGEPDTNLKIKKENHEVFKFVNNVITEKEVRKNINLQTLNENYRKFMYQNLYNKAKDDKEQSNKSLPQNQHNK